MKRQIIIRQNIDDRLGRIVRVLRVLQVEQRLYVEVWQTADVTELDLMKAVNEAIETYDSLCGESRDGKEDEGT